MFDLIKTAIKELNGDSLSGLMKASPSLENINIETSFACNMNCRICSRNKSDRPLFMEPNLFNKIITELIDTGYRGGIALHYAGEPLLHPQLDQLLGMIFKHSFSSKVSFYTNGLLLNKKAALLHRNLISSLHVSIDGPADYSSQYRGIGSYERICNNLIRLRQTYQDFFDVTVHVTLFKQTAGELTTLINDISPLVDKIRISPSIDQETMRFTTHPSVNLPMVDLSKRACPILWNSMTVLTDGNMNACCFNLGADKQIKGLNLSDISLLDAFSSSTYNKVRNNFLRRNFTEGFESCKDCFAWLMAGVNLFRLRIKKVNNKQIALSNGYATKYYNYRRSGYINKPDSINSLTN